MRLHGACVRPNAKQCRGKVGACRWLSVRFLGGEDTGRSRSRPVVLVIGRCWPLGVDHVILRWWTRRDVHCFGRCVVVRAKRDAVHVFRWRRRQIRRAVSRIGEHLMYLRPAMLLNPAHPITRVVQSSRCLVGRSNGFVEELLFRVRSFGSARVVGVSDRS